MFQILSKVVQRTLFSNSISICRFIILRYYRSRGAGRPIVKSPRSWDASMTNAYLIRLVDLLLEPGERHGAVVSLLPGSITRKSSRTVTEWKRMDRQTGCTWIRDEGKGERSPKERKEGARGVGRVARKNRTRVSNLRSRRLLAARQDERDDFQCYRSAVRRVFQHHDSRRLM